MLDPNPSRPLGSRECLIVVVGCACIVALLLTLGCASGDLTPYRVAYGVAAAGDIASTTVALQRGATETNPLLSWAGDYAGYASLIPKALLAWAAESVAPSTGRWLYLCGAALFAGLTVWNISQINKQDTNTTPLPRYVGLRLAF